MQAALLVACMHESICLHMLEPAQVARQCLLQLPTSPFMVSLLELYLQKDGLHAVPLAVCLLRVSARGCCCSPAWEAAGRR